MKFGTKPCSGIILRYTNYGEADRIVTLLTLEHGICSGFARNARNSRKRFGGALQPFNRVRVYWQRRRRGGLPQMAEVELIEVAAAVMSDLDAMALAACACELVAALVPEQQQVEDVYTLVLAFLRHLSALEDARLARLLFELRLLQLLGLLPHIGHCARCWCALEQEWLRFDAARGGTLCSACNAGGSGVAVAATTLGSLVRLLRVDYQQFDNIRLSEQTLAQAVALVRQTIRQHLPRPLKSELFLEQLQRGVSPVLP